MGLVAPDGKTATSDATISISDIFKFVKQKNEMLADALAEVGVAVNAQALSGLFCAESGGQAAEQCFSLFSLIRIYNYTKCKFCIKKGNEEKA